MNPADVIYDTVIEKFRGQLRPVRVFLKLTPSSREIVQAQDALTGTPVPLEECDIEQVENAISMLKWAVLNDEDRPPPEVVDFLRSV